MQAPSGGEEPCAGQEPGHDLSGPYPRAAASPASYSNDRGRLQAEGPCHEHRGQPRPMGTPSAPKPAEYGAQYEAADLGRPVAPNDGNQ
jgi:hypothetical protein